MMAKIYLRASQVLCWLDESDETAEDAFDAFEELCWAAEVCIWRNCAERLSLPLQQITFDILQSEIAVALPPLGEDEITVFQMLKSRIIYPQVLKRIPSAIPTTFSTPDLEKLASATFSKSAFIAGSLVSGTRNLTSFLEFSMKIQAIHDTFVHRSYRHRLWIIQECLLANEAVLICGERHFDLDMIWLIWSITNEGRVNLLSKNCDDFVASEFVSCLWKLTAIFNRRYRKEVPTLFESVFEIDDRACSEPRDRIYALLCVSSAAGILVEYDKPIPTVYAEATRAMIC
jgi:Heterokaryon incompatibility protein (HET)